MASINIYELMKLYHEKKLPFTKVVSIMEKFSYNDLLQSVDFKVVDNTFQTHIYSKMQFIEAAVRRGYLTEKEELFIMDKILKNSGVTEHDKQEASQKFYLYTDKNNQNLNNLSKPQNTNQRKGLPSPTRHGLPHA